MKEGGWLGVDRADAAMAMYTATCATCYATRITDAAAARAAYIIRVRRAASGRTADHTTDRMVVRWVRFLDLAQPDYHIASRSYALLPELVFPPAGRRPSRRALLDTSLRSSNDSAIILLLFFSPHRGPRRIHRGAWRSSVWPAG